MSMTQIEESLMFLIELRSMAIQWMASSDYQTRICGEGLKYLLKEYKCWEEK